MFRLTWLEDEGDANGRANALRQQNLIVPSAKGRHHQPEDVEEAAEEDEVTGAKVVMEGADDGPHGVHEEDLQRRDPGDCARGVVAENVVLVVLLESPDTCSM